MENTAIYKSFILDEIGLVDSDEEKGTYKFIMTKQVPDRGNAIVHIAGINTTNFNNNPVVLYNHDLSLPIGKVKSMYVEDDKLVGLVNFHNITQLSREVGQMVDSGFLKTVSLGFIPTKITKEPMTKAMHDSGQYYKTTNVITHYEEIEIFELSIVSVPANPQAMLLKDINGIITKSGAVLNSRNTALIQNAVDLLLSVLDSATPDESIEEEQENVENSIEEEVVLSSLDTVQEDDTITETKAIRYDSTILEEILKNLGK